MNIIGRDKSLKLLALCFLFGDEAFVFGDKLREDVLYAARNYGFLSMKVPDPDAVAEIQQRVNEIRTEGKPDWVLQLEEEYQVEFPRWKENGVCIPESIDRKAGRS